MTSLIQDHDTSDLREKFAYFRIMTSNLRLELGEAQNVTEKSTQNQMLNKVKKGKDWLKKGTGITTNDKNG